MKKNTEALVILRFGAYQPLYSRPSLGCLNFINTLICNYAPVQAQMYKVLAFRMTSKHLHDCLNSGWPTITRWTGQKIAQYGQHLEDAKLSKQTMCMFECVQTFETHRTFSSKFIQNPSNSSKIHPISFQFQPKSIQIEVGYPYPSKFQKGLDVDPPGYRAREIRLDRSRCVFSVDKIRGFGKFCCLLCFQQRTNTYKYKYKWRKDRAEVPVALASYF